MKSRLLTALALLLLAAGCHQNQKVSGRVAPDDVVGIYARQRGITREQAEQAIRKEAAAARANAVAKGGPDSLAIGVPQAQEAPAAWQVR